VELNVKEILKDNEKYIKNTLLANKQTDIIKEKEPKKK
jgi:hypothetical protein